jgi:polyferredoxin
LEAFGIEKVGIFYGHLEYNSAIWYMSCPFGILVAIFGIFSPFGILYQEKSGNPAPMNHAKRGIPRYQIPPGVFLTCSCLNLAAAEGSITRG